MLAPFIGGESPIHKVNIPVEGIPVRTLIRRLEQKDPDSVVYVKDDIRIGFSGYPEGRDYFVLGNAAPETSTQ